MANANGWGDGSVNNNIGWGQGANNTIGWGNSQLTSWSGATDIDGGNLPSNSVAPAITGTAQEGQTLTCSTGTWSGSPTYTYQWKRNGNNIGSATNSTYTLVTADVGQNILCTVTATNFVGSATADSNTVTPTSSTDADAQAFITAASITDPTQQSAINQLVVDLKGYSIWTKMKAIYPFVGGTNSQHSWNLKNTAQYQITWAGGVTSSNLGVKFNGTNSYGNTGFNPSLNSSLNSNGLGFYSGTNLSETSLDPVNIGALNIGDFYVILKSNTTFTGRLNSASISASSAIMRGFFSAQKTSSTVTTIYKESTSLATGNSGGGLPNVNLFLGTLNLAGTPYGSGYIVNDMRFAYISDGLNSTEIGNLYTAVQAFQTTLGRSIGTQTVSDADAQAFVTNAGIVDQVEANAINNLVIGLKADSLWTKMKAVYPMVGGSSSTMKYNLKNPLDTDAAFRLVFNGGWTFSSNGALPNGTNAYADTKFNLITNFTTTSNASIGTYLINDTSGNGVDMGAGTTGSAGQGMLIYSSFSGTLFYGCANGNTVINSGVSNTDSRGFYSVVRNAGVQSQHKRGNITINSSETEAVGSLSSINLWIGGGNAPAPQGYMYGDRQTAFNFIGDALSQSEIDNLYTTVQAFQTTLGRQV